MTSIDLSSSTPENSDRPTATPCSVSDLSLALKQIVETHFEWVRVRGEISQPKKHSSGHWYLRLKDDKAVIEAVCWKGTAARLSLDPADGIDVICTGRITTYPGRSQYQLVIETMELAGEGALLKMLEDRKRRLAAEGLFDLARKKKLPLLPGVIGVVTSPTGAVIQDIIHRLSDRFPCRVLVWPVAVQGQGAASQVIVAIKGFNQLLVGDKRLPRHDVIIVARGGGSFEDLMAFNDEELVRTVAQSSIPIISAVGHETDTTLIDFAADQRAPTPTAAAEIAVPVRSDLVAAMLNWRQRLFMASTRLLNEKQLRLRALRQGLTDPLRLIQMKAQNLDDRTARLHVSIGVLYKQARWKLTSLSQLLESYSFKKTLERGFSIVSDSQGRIISSVKAVHVGQHVQVRWSDGAANATMDSGSGSTRRKLHSPPSVPQPNLFDPQEKP